MKFRLSIQLLAICILAFTISNAYAQDYMKFYLKDGKINDEGDKVYTLDRIEIKVFYIGSGQVQEYEPMQGSDVVFSNNKLILDASYKMPDTDNPTVFNVVPSWGIFEIEQIQSINGG